ncbi:MAG: hypothetical protein FWE28_00100 [Oscillospiraceae bacterium]|nr:hypothetical protein [Oscillospiraceae bacterium]
MKSKKIILIAIAILVVICLVLAGFILSFRGSQRELSEAEQLVDNFLRAYHEKDPRAGMFLTTSVFDDSDMTYDGVQGHLAETLTHTIIGERVDENDPQTIWIDVEVDNIDLAEILRGIENIEETNPNRILDSIEEYVNSPNAPRRTFQASVIVRVYPVGMRIQMNAELSDALLGGFPSYISEGLGL